MPDTEQNEMFDAPASPPPLAAERALPFVVIDCETSGLPKWDLPADAPGQPRLAALAMISTTPGLAITKELMLYIKPEGWYMEPGASAVNGLTQEFLMDKGVPVKEALDAYEAAIDSGYVFAAFNAQFDLKIMRGEFQRAGRPDPFEQTFNLCVMRKSTGVCKIPKKDGNGYKFPKLSEALAHFKIRQHGAHTALGDAQGALAVLRALQNIGIDLTPEIYKAKGSAEWSSLMAIGEKTIEIIAGVLPTSGPGLTTLEVHGRLPFGISKRAVRYGLARLVDQGRARCLGRGNRHQYVTVAGNGGTQAESDHRGSQDQPPPD